jgi:hypothetical protein
MSLRLPVHRYSTGGKCIEEPIAFWMVSRFVATSLSLSISLTIFGLLQANAARLRENLVQLRFPGPMNLDRLRRLADSLRGGNLRQLKVFLDWRGERSLDLDAINALFTKKDFPCLESFEYPPRSDSDSEAEDDSDEEANSVVDEDPVSNSENDWVTENSNSEEDRDSKEDSNSAEDPDSEEDSIVDLDLD